MTLLEKLKAKRELRKIWSPKPAKRKPLTKELKVQNKISAEGWAVAIQRWIEKELAAEAEDQKLIAATFKAAFSRECLMNVADVTIRWVKPNLTEVQNVFQLTPRKSSQAGDPKHLR